MATPASELAHTFNALNQTFSILGSDGQTEIPITVSEVDSLYIPGFAIEVNYGSQIGASFVMLLVMLTMTPVDRLIRVTTLINLITLALNVTRCMLLSLYFTSTWFGFYTILSGDVSAVTQTDYNVSVAGGVLSIPITILLETSLAIQAWSMIQIWAGMYRWGAMVLSATLLLAAVAFKFAEIALSSESILYNNISVETSLWVQEVDLALTAVSIFWFCFLFIGRLIIHMWMHRSILPPVKGLSAMEVLVMTNGILMLVPVIFAGLEFGRFMNFESGSLTYSSVIVVLPLGTLIAQRLANPCSFGASGANARYNMIDSTGSIRPILGSGLDTTMTGPSGRNAVRRDLMSITTVEKGAMNPVDLELARIDRDDDLDVKSRVYNSRRR